MAITVQDLLDRFDQRLIADLAADDGNPPGGTEILTHPRVVAALQDAIGEVRSAVLQGKRYTWEELEALGTEDLAYLKRVVTTRAILNLAAARVSTFGQENYHAAQRWVEEKLDQLARGERIFATAGAQAAGLPKTEGPSLVSLQRMNLLVDRCAEYYPERGERMANP